MSELSPNRTQEIIQEMVDNAPKANGDTHSVEADYAELRHYLARLARRSRCFSRYPKGLKAALKLFMYCFNRRQLHKQRFPHYPAHVFQFS